MIVEHSFLLTLFLADPNRSFKNEKIQVKSATLFNDSMFRDWKKHYFSEKSSQKNLVWFS